MIPLGKNLQSSRQQNNQKHRLMGFLAMNPGRLLARVYIAYNSTQEKDIPLKQFKKCCKLAIQHNGREEGKRDVQDLIKEPNFTISSWFWNSMSIVMK